MYISKLELQFFKNYVGFKSDLSSRINVIVGLNGAGKTNLLDAIHYLAFTKSAFLNTDSQNIQHEAQYFAIHGYFSDDRKVTCYIENGKKKLLKVNGEDVEKNANHIGTIPLVLTTPYDTAILREGSEVRRKFVDGTISQIDKEFLQSLMTYQKVLRQRNAFLKSLVIPNLSTNEKKLIDVYDQQIMSLSKIISGKRREFIEGFWDFFERSYREIGSDREQVNVKIQTSCLEENFEKNYLDHRQKDLYSQRTNLGCHKDDFEFTLNGEPVKKIGSQGQQKTFYLALRLAQYEFLKEKKDKKPILLLDDVFDKLDEQRIKKIISMIQNESRFGQVFITDARIDRTRSLFEQVGEINFIEIEEGKRLETDA